MGNILSQLLTKVSARQPQEEPLYKDESDSDDSLHAQLEESDEKESNSNCNNNNLDQRISEASNDEQRQLWKLVKQQCLSSHEIHMTKQRQEEQEQRSKASSPMSQTGEEEEGPAESGRVGSALLANNGLNLSALEAISHSKKETTSKNACVEFRQVMIIDLGDQIEQARSFYLVGNTKSLGHWDPYGGVLFEALPHDEEDTDFTKGKQSLYYAHFGLSLEAVTLDSNECSDRKSSATNPADFVKLPETEADQVFGFQLQYKIVSRRVVTVSEKDFVQWAWEKLPRNRNRELRIHWQDGTGESLSGSFADTIIPRFSWKQGVIQFKIYYPLPEQEVMAITGDPSEMGGWIHPGPVAMQLSDKEELLPSGLGDSYGKYWFYTIPRPSMAFFSYRYVIVNKETGTARFEREPNRQFKPYVKYLMSPLEQDETCRISNTELPAPVFRVVDVNFNSNLEFDLVPPSIIIGPYIQNEEEILKIKASGVQAVLSVQSDDDLKHRKIDWPGVVACYQQHDIQVARVPIVDFNPKSLEDNLYKAAQKLNDFQANGLLTYVHCTAGMSRAVATVIIYMVIFQKRFSTVDEAFAFVKQHRPVAAPNLQVVKNVAKRHLSDPKSTYISK